MIFIKLPKKVLLLAISFLLLTTSQIVKSDTNNLNSFNLSSNSLSVYLDLERRIDEDFIREEIPVVDYVRDKELADVHIIMTRHRAGSTGTNYFISFIGAGDFEGMDNELNFWASASMTSHEIREGYTNMIKFGLAPYMANIENMSDKMFIEYDSDIIEDPEDPEITEEEEDPWRRWIFEIYGGTNFSMEETRSSIHVRYGFYADKVTEDWKIRARPYFNYNERSYEVNDTTVTTISHRDGFDGYVIKSITDHWSAGIFTDMLSSTFHNMDFQAIASPAVEYSIFPYDEATRRSITFAYKVDFIYNDYIEETVFEKTEETLFGHSLVASANFRQPWGNFRAGVTGSHHFHDFKSNRVELFGRLTFRIFKGFSLSLRANYDFINDLVSIPMEDLSEEEILLEQRRRATDYEFSGNISLTYTFGSDLSGDYNPRL